MTLICVKRLKVGAKLSGIKFAVVRGQLQHLMPRILNRARLMQRDMPRSRSDYPLIRAQQRINDNTVRLRAAGEEENIGIRAGKRLADTCLGTFTEAVRSIAGLRLEIRLHQSL